jgi:hypothetical protein
VLFPLCPTTTCAWQHVPRILQVCYKLKRAAGCTVAAWWCPSVRDKWMEGRLAGIVGARTEPVPFAVRLEVAKLAGFCTLARLHICCAASQPASLLGHAAGDAGQHAGGRCAAAGHQQQHQGLPVADPLQAEGRLCAGGGQCRSADTALLGMLLLCCLSVAACATLFPCWHFDAHAVIKCASQPFMREDSTEVAGEAAVLSFAKCASCLWHKPVSQWSNPSTNYEQMSRLRPLIGLPLNKGQDFGFTPNKRPDYRKPIRTCAY